MVLAAKPATAPARPPTDSEMRVALGAAYAGFQELVAEAGPGAAEWRRYARSSPWVLKVSEGKRSLFYARPDAGHLRVTVLLGERAVEAALAGRVSKVLWASIRSAKAYPEGRPVSLLVKRASDLAKVKQLIAVKRETTSKASRSKAGPGGGR